MYTVIKITIASYLVICKVFIIRKVHQLHYRLDILYTFSFTKKNHNTYENHRYYIFVKMYLKYFILLRDLHYISPR